MTDIVRVAVVGDVHIGAQARAVDVRGGEGPRLRDYSATERLIEAVVAARPDAVLITGDLFDRSDGSERALALAQHLLDVWCEQIRAVAIIGGNHDAESELPAQLRLPASARWFSAQHAETLVLPTLRLAIHGMSVLERDDLRDVFDSYPDPIDGVFNIGMLHTSLDGQWSRRTCLPVSPERLRSDSRYGAWALGHVHRQLVLGDHPLIVYPGGVHARGDGETDAPGLAPAFTMLEIEHSGGLGIGQSRARVIGVGAGVGGEVAVDVAAGVEAQVSVSL